MIEEFVDFLTRILLSIFKKRPYIVFFVLLFIGAAVMGTWIMAAQTPDERIFPIIGLAFVLIVLAWYTRLIIRRWDIIKNQTYDQPEQPSVREPEFISTEPAAAASPPMAAFSAQAPAVPIAPVAGGAQAKPSVQALHVILGAVASVVMSAPLVLIASLAMAASPIVENDQVEGFALLVGLLLCLLIPVAAGLGALFGAVFSRRARVRTTGHLNKTALLAGGVTGFVLGLIAMVVFYVLATINI